MMSRKNDVTMIIVYGSQPTNIWLLLKNSLVYHIIIYILQYSFFIISIIFKKHNHFLIFYSSFYL